MEQALFDEVLATYSGLKGAPLGQAGLKLFQRYGFENLTPKLIAAYPKIGRSEGRVAILSSLLRYARRRDDVVDLARIALVDRAYLARSEACAILAYSLKDEVVPELELLLGHTHRETRADAAAAVDAIRHKNHHFFVDRKHTGSTFWNVNPGDIQSL
jgi:hypothetical protein